MHQNWIKHLLVQLNNLIIQYEFDTTLTNIHLKIIC